MELEELRKALESGGIPSHLQPSVRNSGYSERMFWCKGAEAGFVCRQPEIDDLKGMIALLVASLKRVSSKYGHDEDGMPSDWSAWVEAREFIAEAEAMVKGEKE